MITFTNNDSKKRYRMYRQIYRQTKKKVGEMISLNSDKSVSYLKTIQKMAHATMSDGQKSIN